MLNLSSVQKIAIEELEKNDYSADLVYEDNQRFGLEIYPASWIVQFYTPDEEHLEVVVENYDPMTWDTDPDSILPSEITVEMNTEGVKKAIDFLKNFMENV